MDLPASLPMHPADLFFGMCFPQVQTYLSYAPDLMLDEQAPLALEALLREHFPRFCYGFPQRWGTIPRMRLASSIAEPVRLWDGEDFRALSAAQLEDGLAQRHWQLHLVQGEQGVVLVFTMDHLLCHGFAGRAFLYAALDLLRGGGPPPVLAPRHEEEFVALQEHLTALFHGLAPWAAHRRVQADGERLRRLAEALGLPFTETAALWLGRTIHDTGARERPMDLLIFRMDRRLDQRDWVDLQVGNRGLQLISARLEADGSYDSLEPPSEAQEQAAERFAALYPWLPFKFALAWGLRTAVQQAQRASQRRDREKLVVNNLGSTDYPFFRTMFFDPVNQADSLGLVFIDGRKDELQLQFAPPLRYLERFDWEDFEARLDRNLEAMVVEPRLRCSG